MLAPVTHERDRGSRSLSLPVEDLWTARRTARRG